MFIIQCKFIYIVSWNMAINETMYRCQQWVYNRYKIKLGSSLFLIRSKVDWNIEQYFKTFDCDYVYIVQCHAMSRKYMYWFTPTWMYEYKLSSWNTFHDCVWKRSYNLNNKTWLTPTIEYTYILNISQLRNILFRLDQVTVHIHLLGKSRRFRCMIKLCK